MLECSVMGGGHHVQIEARASARVNPIPRPTSSRCLWHQGTAIFHQDSQHKGGINRSFAAAPPQLDPKRAHTTLQRQKLFRAQHSSVQGQGALCTKLPPQRVPYPVMGHRGDIVLDYLPGRQKGRHHCPCEEAHLGPFLPPAGARRCSP